MTQVINTGDLTPDSPLDALSRLQVYCGLDSCVTSEVHEKITPQLTPVTNAIYDFERALQAPVLEMMLRGILVDQFESQKLRGVYEKRKERIGVVVDTLAEVVWGRGLNPNSPKQCIEFFYDSMGLPRQFKYEKGKKKLTVDREALEKLTNYRFARPLANGCLSFRDMGKKIGVLRSGIDDDGRMRFSYNIGGTNTGRFSCNENVFGGGCLLPTAEVLTYEGWKSLKEFTGGEIVQWSPEEGLSFAEAKPYITDYSGKLYTVKTTQTELTMTEGHRVPFFNSRMLDFREDHAANVAKLSQECLLLGDSFIGGCISYPRLVVALLADGSKEKKRWRIAFKKQRKIDRFLELCEEAGVEVTEQKARPGYRRFSIEDRDWPVKWDSWILYLDHETMKKFVREAAYWDSSQDTKSRAAKSYDFFTASKHTASWFATLCHLAGNSCTVNTQEQSKGSWSDTLMYRVRVKNRRHARIQQRHWSAREYNGYVYCVSVPSTYFLVRQNGNISVTGNTNGNNITDELRRIFISGKGKKLAYLDLEQAESRVVAYLSGDQKYIDACESSDLHVHVAKLIWKDLEWSERARPNTPPDEYDRSVAERKFYRHFSYRDLSKRGGHLCLTEDHEILTPEGWKPISSKPGVIMAWHEKPNGEQESRFEEVWQWTDAKYTGNLFEFSGNSVSALMTSEHRVPYKADPKSKGIHTRPARLGPQARMPLGGGYIGGDEIVPARLLAAFMSDGEQSSTNRITFHLKKRRKIERLYEIAQIYGFEVNATANNKYRIWAKDMPKRAGAFMFNWTSECLRDFLDEYKHWDGHIGRTSVTLSSSDEEHIHWIQTFGRILGIGGNIGRSETKWGSHYRLQQNNRQWANGDHMKWRYLEVDNTRVLCPTVNSEFFYVRRNGKIFVTGNTNYRGQPDSNARQLKVSREVMRNFNRTYLSEFAGIRRWHTDVARVLQTEACITTPLGRKRLFFGRGWDDSILRKAIAFNPQSTIGDLLNLGMWRVWKQVPEVDLLTQLYDAILIEYDEEIEDEVIPRIIDLMTIKVPVTDTCYKGAETREMVIPVDASVGWNWGKHHPEKNPDGLVKFRGHDERKRTVAVDAPIMTRTL